MVSLMEPERSLVLEPLFLNFGLFLRTLTHYFNRKCVFFSIFYFSTADNCARGSFVSKKNTVLGAGNSRISD